MHTRHTGHGKQVENLTSELGENFATCGGKEVGAGRRRQAQAQTLPNATPSA